MLIRGSITRLVSSRIILLVVAMAATGCAFSAAPVIRGQAAIAAAPIVRVQATGGRSATLDHVHWVGDFGVVLKNTSLTRDALNVDVFAKFYSHNGQLVGDDTPIHIKVIPARSTFYCADLAVTSGSITRVVATVRIGKTEPHHIDLPPMRNARLEPATGKDRIAVATIINTTKRTLKGLELHAYAIFFGRNGTVLGGDFSGTTFDRIPPGRRAEVRYEVIAPTATAYVKASADPD